MKLIKRCWGCGKRVLPWQNTIHTKLAGDIHKGCAFNAIRNYENDKKVRAFNRRLEENALKRLNGDETK
jgi:hypothetical protein